MTGVTSAGECAHECFLEQDCTAFTLLESGDCTLKAYTMGPMGYVVAFGEGAVSGSPCEDDSRPKSPPSLMPTSFPKYIEVPPCKTEEDMVYNGDGLGGYDIKTMTGVTSAGKCAHECFLEQDC